MSQVDTKSRPTCIAISSIGVSVESTATGATVHVSEEGTAYLFIVKISIRGALHCIPWEDQLQPLLHRIL